MRPQARQTLDWVSEHVVGLGLCPFAAKPLRDGLIEVEICAHSIHEDIFYWAGAQVQYLLQKSEERVETTLLVIPDALSDFEDFLGMVGALEALLGDSGADEWVQLAHFHPDYVFAGVAADDPANATNRSPYPTIQLLRATSVARAVATHPDVEGIPARNMALLRGRASN